MHLAGESFEDGIGAQVDQRSEDTFWALVPGSRALFQQLLYLDLCFHDHSHFLPLAHMLVLMPRPQPRFLLGESENSCKPEVLHFLIFLQN